jgi:hypothetical protein
MLTVDSRGRPQLAVAHLFEMSPMQIDEIIERYTKLDGTLFHHIISSPSCRYEKGFGCGRVPTNIAVMSAKERFKSILTGQCIQGNPKSYFVNKLKGSLTATQIEEIKSVSFALCEHAMVKRHFEARDSMYGICFHHDFLQDRGVRPVVYVNDSAPDEMAQIVFNSPYLVETYGGSYNMQWENEWRIKGELRFEADDIAFLIVPDEDYLTMYEWLSQGNFEECVLFPASVYDDPISYLYMIPKLQHQAWHQIPIDGEMKMKMDFEEFLPATAADRRSMTAQAGAALECLVKAAVHEVYEARYAKRFFRFAHGIKDDTLEKLLATDLNRIVNNSKEPTKSIRDLVISAYSTLFRIQADRITKDWF